MNRDRQPNRNTRKPYQPPVIQDRRTSQDRGTTQNKRPTQNRSTFYNERTTSVPLPSKNRRPVAVPPQEPGGKSFFVIGIFIALILLLLAAAGLYAWNLSKSDNNTNQTLFPANTVTPPARSGSGDGWCWASRYSYNQLQGFAIYPGDGQASLVINEEDASKANARPQGSWALVIIKGPNALVTVVSVAQAHSDAQTWQGPHGIEQANYSLTKVNDPEPA